MESTVYVHLATKEGLDRLERFAACGATDQGLIGAPNLHKDETASDQSFGFPSTR